MKRYRYFLFAALAVGLSTVGFLLICLAGDLYLHKKFEKSAGLNYRGYRGKVVGKKTKREKRVVALGGSTVFGYGVLPNESFPYLLEKQFENIQPSIQVINLGRNNQGAFAYYHDLKSYKYLEYDLVILYEGYNELNHQVKNTKHRSSPVFKLTGYYPIFPIVFTEKALAIRHGGDLEGAYWGKKTVFRPNVLEKTAVSVLNSAVSVNRSLERQLDKLPAAQLEKIKGVQTNCGKWQNYCESVLVATQYVLDQNKKVLVVGQPFINDVHRDQQAHLASMIHQRFSTTDSVRYLSLGHSVDLTVKQMAYDGMHLTAEGNLIIAKALQPVVGQMLNSTGLGPSIAD